MLPTLPLQSSPAFTSLSAEHQSSKAHNPEHTPPDPRVTQGVEDGEVVFNHGEITKSINIKLMEEETLVEGNETFEVVLYDATDGATIGKTRRTMVSLLKDEGRWN